MRRFSLFLSILFVLTLNGCSSLRTTTESIPSTHIDAAATHYRQHGDAASLRRVVAELKPGMQKSTIIQLLGPPVYSPLDNQDYYPTEVRHENGYTLVLVVNYHQEGAAKAGTLEWFFLDYIGE